MKYWVIGGGKFGSRAVDCLVKKTEASVTLIDADPAGLEAWRGRVETILADGVDFLVHHLDGGNRPDWIVAAIPVHLAYEWIRLTPLQGTVLTSLPVPARIARQVPHPLQGAGGELYVSHAETLCPDDCPEPSGRCFQTGRPRGANLYQHLRNLPEADVHSVVVRSYQLAPGVGGYPPQALLEARAAVARIRGVALLSTACSCHGVMHAFEVNKQ